MNDGLLQWWFGPTNNLVNPSLLGPLNGLGIATPSLTLPGGTAGVSFQLSAIIFDPLSRPEGVTSPITISVF